MTEAKPSLPSRLFAGAGHLAVWLGLYFGAAYVIAVLLLDRRLQPVALVSAFAAGVGLYLLDRVKPRDAWLDPADLAAQPVRIDFLLTHRRPVRTLAWALLALGTAGVMWINPANILLPPVGIGGVIIYGSVRGPRARPKDKLLLKNMLPGGAIPGLAVVLAWQSPGGAGAPPTLVEAACMLLGLVLIVTTDAVLCDLDDAEADREHGTRTIPNTFGPGATWVLALAAQLAAGVLWVSVGRARDAVFAAEVLTGANVALSMLLAAARPSRVRDLVDLKLSIVAGLALLAARGGPLLGIERGAEEGLDAVSHERVGTQREVIGPLDGEQLGVDACTLGGVAEQAGVAERHDAVACAVHDEEWALAEPGD